MLKILKYLNKINHFNSSRKLRKENLNQFPLLFNASPSYFLLLILSFLMAFKRYPKACAFMEKTGMKLDEALNYFETLEGKNIISQNKEK